MKLFKKELPVVFGRVKAGVYPDSPLPNFKTFDKFDTQVKTLSHKHALELRIREKVKLLTTLARTNMTSEASQIVSFCISSAVRFVMELLDWMVKEYHSMGVEAGAEVDSSKVDWLFIGSTVKAIFRELHRICTEG